MATPTQNRMLFLYASQELFFRAKVEQICVELGFDYHNCRNLDELEMRAHSHADAIFLVDLNSNEKDLSKLGTILFGKAGAIGYYSHTSQDLARRALGSGISRIVPRSRLESYLRELLSKRRHSD